MRGALILGHGDTAYAVIRSLSKAKIKPILLSTSPRRYDSAHFSRHCGQLVDIPPSQRSGTHLLQFIMESKEDWDGFLLIPTTDPSIAFVAQNRNTLRRRYIPAAAEWKTVKKMLNKRLLYIQAKKEGIPIPETYFPTSIPGAVRLRSKLSYPCILKPYEKSGFYRFFGGKVCCIQNPDELIPNFTKALRHHLEVMVSEIIPGDDACLFHYRSYRTSEGTFIAEMCTQKLKQHPPHFGVASVSRTVPMIHEIRDLGRRLLKSLDYGGVSSIEFKWDQRDHRFKLMEINARHVIPEWLFVSSGMNFPHIVYQDMVENVRRPFSSYRTNVCWINPFFEGYEFFRNLGAKRFSLRDFLRPCKGKSRVLSVNFFDDPVAFLVRSLGLLGIIIKQAVGRYS